jgi:hypothetical protein
MKLFNYLFKRKKEEKTECAKFTNGDIFSIVKSLLIQPEKIPILVIWSKDFPKFCEDFKKYEPVKEIDGNNCLAKIDIYFIETLPLELRNKRYQLLYIQYEHNVLSKISTHQFVDLLSMKIDDWFENDPRCIKFSKEYL